MASMKEIQVEKVTLNIGTGKPGPELEKALKLLEQITGVKPVETKTQKRIPSWSLRPGLSIGAKVTLRGEKAVEVLKRLLDAVEYYIPSKKFDNEGNFSFGIKEYIDIPGMKYNMDIGIMGLEVAVTLKRPGFRIKRRMIKTKKIPRRHRISKEEAIKFMQENFNVKTEQEGEE
ncbi:50S ribosomal protein L5 [Candidatus Woesearchaeota archaeon]|nr:MAG: 50S ribosomal protein L5 [Candidatus Woesearchaeota archaeon]